MCNQENLKFNLFGKQLLTSSFVILFIYIIKNGKTSLFLLIPSRGHACITAWPLVPSGRLGCPLCVPMDARGSEGSPPVEVAPRLPDLLRVGVAWV